MKDSQSPTILPSNGQPSAEPSAVRNLVAYALDSYWDELAFGHVELDVVGRAMIRELRVLARIANAEIKALTGKEPS